MVADTDKETGGGEISAGTLNGKYSSVWKAVFARDKSFLRLSEEMNRDATEEERQNLLLCYKGGQKLADELLGLKPTRECRRCRRKFVAKGHLFSWVKCRKATSRQSDAIF
ncbi:MAG: hypothetical protein M3Q07_07550 [Pseudobdellovibrionaceae bacterium]|nr:hypothetical protein [Pseudobdellovibrionaceae bacterium]